MALNQDFLYNKAMMKTLRTALHPLKQKVVRQREKFLLPDSSLVGIEEGVDHIRDTLSKATPSAIAKIGSGELYLYRWFRKGSASREKACKKATGIAHSSGFFPDTQEACGRFADVFEDRIRGLSTIALWRNAGEAKTVLALNPEATYVQTPSLFNFYREDERFQWTPALAGKRVLVISPFEASIQDQYAKRSQIWRHEKILPEFELKTLKTPLSAWLSPSPYKDWFDGLEDLENKMANIDFDVALIGAGAWSLPLAVQAKRLAKIGIHLGGAMQVLFGIIGGRWIQQNNPHLIGQMNETWTQPSADESPRQENLDKVRGVDNYW